MKLVSTQLTYFFHDPQARRNVRALMKFVVVLFGFVALFSVLFHVIMLQAEGRYHSWITGVYWTLTVMSTLGFGDITFSSDIGRAFSLVVLVTGIVLLLIVLPFAFIRFFYAPWLEAQMHMRAPRAVPPGTEGHVLLCAYDEIARGLIERCRFNQIPYFVLEPDPARASQLMGDGVSVIAGDLDSRATYEAVAADKARMVLVNATDTMNTNITLTVREVAPEVPLVALASIEDAVDILELSGATHVLPLKQRLGEQLANRVNAGRAQGHVIGAYRDLLFAELPVHNTPLAGRTVRETRLREIVGVSIAGVWERGRLLAVRPDLKLSSLSVPVVIGTAEQLELLNDLVAIYDMNPNPVLVIGGGKVGRAVTRALLKQEIPVHLIEKNAAMREKIAHVTDRVFIGDAADRDLLMEAGLAEAPSVVLTTNDDAMNIYLATYCRRLNPESKIISRITHERNVEAIHRAGADFMLSYASFGVGAVFALLLGKELVMLGEGVNLFHVPTPASLEGKPLTESGIGAQTGLSVIAVHCNGEVVTNPPASLVLQPGSELLMMGSTGQRQEFSELFE